MSPTVLVIVTVTIPCLAVLIRVLAWYWLVWCTTKREPKRAAKILDAARPRGLVRSRSRGG